MYFYRDITPTLLRYSKFPAVALLGPRQSGKRTLVKKVFNNHRFLDFEDPETRLLAKDDPKRLLRENENDHGIILDEFQYVPEILSLLKVIIDEKRRPGYFILSSSQNFLTNQTITQSLAGRVGILTLLPLSLNELIENKLFGSPLDTEALIIKGGYPGLYAGKFSPDEMYPSYLHTYAERDIRQLVNVGNLASFQRFMKLCAGRLGQLLNVTELATACGVSRSTANAWISILEGSYIIYLLQPYLGNFNKRITKSPKLYFYDTGVACSLLNIRSKETLSVSPFRGHLFENLVISDLFKQFFARGTRAPLYFWRNQNGTIEIDGLIDLGSKQIRIGIKAGETIARHFFSGLSKWMQLTGSNPSDAYLIYAGSKTQAYKMGNIVGLAEVRDLVARVEKV